jgi:hypothetical protein
MARSKHQTQFWDVKWLGINPVINSVSIATTAGVACPTGDIAAPPEGAAITLFMI